MTEINAAEVIGKIEKELIVCGDILLHADRSDKMTESKEGHANFVTTYDKMIQNILAEKLLEIVPGAVFVGEEDDVRAQIEKGWSFIVDPIDGTTNFIMDLKESAISVGLLLDGAPYIGVCYNPYLNEMYTAVKGGGAYLNGAPIHVSKKPLSEGLVLFGTAPYYPEFTAPTFNMCADYLKKALDVRRAGSAVLDLCKLAAGRAVRFFEFRLSPWDYAAASLIVEEAGGIITTLENTPLTFDRPCSVFARNREE